MVLGSCNMVGPIAERGNGVAVTTAVKVEGFSSISIPSSIDVVYTVSNEEQSVVFTCDENLLEYYDIHVEGNTLIADTKRGTISLSPKVRTVLAVSAPVLEGVKVSGSGDCTVQGDIPACDHFYLKCSGSGEISVPGSVSCMAFSSSVTGSGEIRVGSINAKSAEISISGSGGITINGISADNIKARTTGSGDINLVCMDAGSIDASISGSGIIRLSGTAGRLQSKRTGSGRIITEALLIP
jgi:hypothetical protein